MLSSLQLFELVSLSCGDDKSEGTVGNGNSIPVAFCRKHFQKLQAEILTSLKPKAVDFSRCRISLATFSAPWAFFHAASQLMILLDIFLMT